MESTQPGQHSEAPIGLARLTEVGPPLPATLLELIALTESGEAPSLNRVVCMVEGDPIVVARLLKIVNSAYYGLKRTIGTVERAVELLGPVTVTGMVMGMNMLRLPPVQVGPTGSCYTRLIRHSVATAHIARIIARALGGLGVPPERAFTAGLVHDFGQMLLVYHEPERALAIYEGQHTVTPGASADTRDLEQLTFGYDHTEAGEYVARTLDFPDNLVDAIRYHHEPESPDRPAESAALVRTIAAADIAATAVGFPFTRTRSMHDFQYDEIWNRLQHPDPETLRRDIVLQAGGIARHVDAATVPGPAPDRPPMGRGKSSSGERKTA